ncbi:MAG: acetyl-CoA carboxylase biotin carboxylase subunit family protein, partial [Candidatus Thorarchaeota archaeon]
MNYVFLSPHFPPNWFNFCVRLKESGFNVLGLGDEPYDSLRAELRNSLTEYYRVENMHNYDQLVRAIGFFIWKYGKIDFIESHNEYWLETEANLRDDFNVNGYRKGNIEAIKRKSIMKRVFQVANIPVAPGQIAISFETAKDFAEKNGYPLIAKPDIGVGAYATYKIHDDQELFDFFTQKPDVTYFLECFIDGTII